MKKLTMIWTIIGIIVTVAAVCAAVFFWLSRKAEKTAAEEEAPEAAAEPEAAEAQAQTA